jgi:hypothetical protein
MNAEGERLRLEKELGVRELAPEEIQAMHNHSKEIDNLVREKYPRVLRISLAGPAGTQRLNRAESASVRKYPFESRLVEPRYIHVAG